MSANGTSQQNLEFSLCSMQEIHNKMTFLSTNRPECFTDRVQVSFSFSFLSLTLSACFLTHIIITEGVSQPELLR